MVTLLLLLFIATIIIECFAMWGGIAPNKILCSLRFFKIRKILQNHGTKWGNYRFLDFEAYPQKFADDVMTFFAKLLLSLYKKEEKTRKDINNLLETFKKSKGVVVFLKTEEEISEKQREIKKTKNNIRNTKNDIKRCQKLLLAIDVKILKNINAYFHYIDWREVKN